MAYVLGLVIVIVSVGIVIKYYSPAWGPAQWGPVASWFAGIATFAAVWVALLQTKRAQDGAAQAKIDAEVRLTTELAAAKARHASQLIQADERLARELDANRMMEQVKAIPPIWQAIADLGPAFETALEAIEAVVDAPGRTQEVADNVREKFTPWLNAIKNLEMVFSPALLVISEPNTQLAITELYEDTRELQDKSLDALGQAVSYQTPDTTEVRQLMTKIHRQRKSITAIVREHLTKAPPLVKRSNSTD